MAAPLLPIISITSDTCSIWTARGTRSIPCNLQACRERPATSPTSRRGISARGGTIAAIRRITTPGTLRPKRNGEHCFLWGARGDPVLRLKKTNRTVVCDFRGAKRGIRNEGIVLRRDHQEGHANLRGDALGACMIVIVLRMAIAELRRGDDVIEFAHRSNPWKPVEPVTLGKQLLFARVTGQ